MPVTGEMYPMRSSSACALEAMPTAASMLPSNSGILSDSLLVMVVLPDLVAPTSRRRRCQCFRLPRFARCLVGSLAPLPDARRKAHQAHRQIEDGQYVD